MGETVFRRFVHCRPRPYQTPNTMPKCRNCGASFTLGEGLIEHCATCQAVKSLAGTGGAQKVAQVATNAAAGCGYAVCANVPKVVAAGAMKGASRRVPGQVVAKVATTRAVTSTAVASSMGVGLASMGGGAAAGACIGGPPGAAVGTVVGLGSFLI